MSDARQHIELLLASALLGCSAQQPAQGTAPPVGTSADVTVKATAPHSPAASAASSSTTSPLPPREDDEWARHSHRRSVDGGCPSYERSMGRGRKRTAAGDYQGAFEAFAEALRARPMSARAWAELGYAGVLAGKDAGPFLLRARSLTKDRTLLSQIWYNEGLMRRSKADAEGARMAFSIAEANGSKAATKQLGGPSRCAATWQVPDDPQPISFASTWGEVASAMNLMCLQAAPRNEAEAKHAACFGCAGWDTKGAEDGCASAPPWRIQVGYQHFHVFYALVQPVPGGRWYIEPYADLEIPALRSVGNMLVRETAETFGEEATVVLPEPDAPTLNSMEYWSDDAPGEDGTGDGETHCQPDLQSEVEIPRRICAQCGEPLFPLEGPRTDHYHDGKTGAELLRIRVHHGDVMATIQGNTATISGGGCEGSLTLRR